LLEGRAWDFLIGSVHEIDGLQFEMQSNYSREQGEALWLRYFELLRGALSSRAFSLVSHPVRMRATNVHLPPHLDDELEQLAAEATRCDVALEVNGYDILTYPSLVKRLVRACVLHKTPISVGSDGHDPRGVAQGHAASEDLLREAGMTQVLVWQGRVPESYAI
jgi:histidinol-phosphatase (PHP family)